MTSNNRAMPSARATGLAASAPDGSSQSSVPIADEWTTYEEWADDGLLPVDDLCIIEVRNRYGDVFGPVLAGMLDINAFSGGALHASCDIGAYRLVPAQAIETQSAETGTGSVPKG